MANKAEIIASTTSISIKVKAEPHLKRVNRTSQQNNRYRAHYHWY